MSFLKSDIVTLLDATVAGSPSRVTAGMGMGGRSVMVTGTMSISATAATTVTHRLVRVPLDAIIHSVSLVTDLQGGTATTITGNIGLFWSSNNQDGTPLLSVASATAISASFFAYQQAMATYVISPAVGRNAFTDVTFANATGNSATDGFYVPSASYQPLWMALTNGGYIGSNSTTSGYLQNAWSGNFSGTGAVSSTSHALYQITQSPGGFADICFTPTATTSMDAAHLMTLRCSYTLPGS